MSDAAYISPIIRELVHACKQGHLADVQRIIDSTFIDLANTPRTFDESPLLNAVENGQLDVVKYLIGRGAPVDTCEASRRIHAIYMSTAHPNVLQYLLEHGGSEHVNRTDIAGWSALLVAAQKDHIPAIRLLLDAGANPRHANSDGETALHIARTRNAMEMIIQAVATSNKKDFVNQFDRNGSCALHRAAAGHFEDRYGLQRIETLLDYEADRDLTDRAGKTALQIARYYRWLPAADLISNHRGNILLAHAIQPMEFVEGELEVDLREEAELGRGAFAVVRPAVIVATNRRVAAKYMLSLDPVAARAYGGRRAAEEAAVQVGQVMDECKIISRLRSSYLVELLGLSFLPPSPAIVFELLVAQPRSQLTTRCADVCRDISVALTCLHRARPNAVIHYDVKPQNVLYDEVTDCFKLADFGLAKYARGSTYASQTFRGTLNYMAPEIMNRNATPSTAVDIFAFGVMCLELYLDDMTDPLPPLDERDRRIPEIERREFDLDRLKRLRGRNVLMVAEIVYHCLENAPESRPPAAALTPFFQREFNDHEMRVRTYSERIGRMAFAGQSMFPPQV